MAIEVELPDGTIAEFPDDMAPADIEAVLSRQFPSEPQETPDASADQASAPSGVMNKLDEALYKIPGGKALAEFAAATNRSVLDFVDFLGPDTANAVLDLVGSERRVTPLAEQIGSEGGFMGDGLARDAVQGAGAAVPAAVGGAGILRQAASQLPKIGAAAEGIIPGVVRQMGAAPIGAEAALGAVSGAGTGAGESVGGTTGALVGGLAAPLSAASAVPAARGAAKSVAQTITGNTPFKQEIKKIIETAGTESKAAKYMLDGAGKVRKDPAAKEAIKQGMDEGIVAAIKGSNPKDMEAMRKMLYVQKRSKRDRRFAAENRPTDVIGDSVVSRVKAVRDANREAGQRLDKVAKGLRGNSVDTSPATSKFLGDLDSMGVQFNDEVGMSFKGSDIEGIDGAEKLIRRVFRRLSEGEVDAYEAHRLKRFIDEQVSFGKTADGLTGKTENILKSLRRNIDSELDSAFPAYNEVNTKYSDTITALDAFKSVAGKNFDPSAPNSEKLAGTLSRRLLSNAQSRIPLMNSLSDLQQVAQKYGTQFDDDIITQSMFADELSSLFGTNAGTSLRGEMDKTADRAVDAVTGNITIPGAAALAGKAGWRAVRGVNEENAMKAIEKLLERPKK